MFILNNDSFKNVSELLEKRVHFMGLSLPSQASDEEFGPRGVAGVGRGMIKGEIIISHTIQLELGLGW